MVASLNNVANEEVQKNDTVDKPVTAGKTLTESIVSLQAQKLKLIKIVEKLTSGKTAVANPRKYNKTP